MFILFCLYLKRKNLFFTICLTKLFVCTAFLFVVWWIVSMSKKLSTIFECQKPHFFLLDYIRDDITVQVTHLREPLSPKEKLWTSLYFAVSIISNHTKGFLNSILPLYSLKHLHFALLNKHKVEADLIRSLSQYYQTPYKMLT